MNTTDDSTKEKQHTGPTDAEFFLALFETMIKEKPECGEKILSMLLGASELHQLLIKKRTSDPYFFALFNDGSLLTLKKENNVLSAKTDKGFTKRSLDILITVINKTKEVG